MDRNRILELIKIASYKYPPIICIEGVSCVGKSYLIDYLKKNLKGKKILVQHNPSSSKLGLKLIEFAKNNNEISNPFLLSCFFLISQNELYEEMQKYSTLDYDLIILDRMVFFSGIVHQGYNSGEGFISCEKSLQLLSLAMNFFFKIDNIFLLTDEVNTIFARRKQYNTKAYRLKHPLLLDAIQREQECYIEFAKKINNINDKFPEPDIYDMSQADTLESILNNVKKILQERDVFN